MKKKSVDQGAMQQSVQFTALFSLFLRQVPQQLSHGQMQPL